MVFLACLAAGAMTVANLLERHGGHRLVPPHLNVRPRQPGQRPPLHGHEEGLVDSENIRPRRMDGQLQQHDEDPGHVVVGGA